MALFSKLKSKFQSYLSEVRERFQQPTIPGVSDPTVVNEMRNAVARGLQNTFNIGPGTKPMSFKVGEGLTSEQTIRAKETLSRIDPLVADELSTLTLGQSIDIFSKYVYQEAQKKMGKEPTTRISPELAREAGESQAVGAIGFVSLGKAPKVPVEKLPLMQRLSRLIVEAEPIRKETEALMSAERTKRAAEIVKIGEKVKGEAGFIEQLKALKGELPKKVYEPIKKFFKQEELDATFTTIEDTKTLFPYEKITVKNAFRKMLEGEVPTEGEIKLLKEVFPKEITEAITARGKPGQKILDVLGQVFNAPRAIMASVDLSAPLRQGIFLVGRPKQFFSAFGSMFKQAFSEDAFQASQAQIRGRETYRLMRKANLALTDLGGSLTTREEAIMSNLPEKIPGMGRIFRGSNRAYTGFLNKLRADVFDDILTKSRATNKKWSEKEFKDLGTFINTASGRGKLGSLESSAVALNAALFSPRLMASRLNLLNPYFYVQLSPVVRKEALKSLFSFAGVTGSVLGLAKMAGAEVNTDPRNADFGKFKIGNTRYDPLGGFQQYIRLAGQLISGEIVSSTTGRTMTLGEGYKPLTRAGIILRFFESKESPVASFIIGLLKGQTFLGEDFDVPTEITNRMIPMVIQDMYELTQEKGAEGFLMSLPAIFGVGVQTYGEQELKFGKSKIGEPTAQIRPVETMAGKIREIVLGQLPLGTSKGYSVEAYFDQLSNLPREEAAQIFSSIAEANPELAKKLMDVVKEREKGITIKDKDLKAKGVASGDRALAIKKQLDKLKTQREKETLWSEYVEKGIITKAVANQLVFLLQQ